MRFWPRSLRLRLTVSFVLVFLVIQLILGGTWVAFRYDARKRDLDAELRAWAAEIAARATVGPQAESRLAEASEYLTGERSVRAYGVELRQRGQVVARHRNDRRFDWRQAETSPPGGWIEARFGDGKDPVVARAITAALPSEDGTLTLVVLPRLAQDLRDLVEDLVLIALPISLVAAAIATWLLAGRATTPLHEMAEAAQSISPSSLDQRILVATTAGEIEGLQDRLNEALARLEEGYHQQARFISNVSHQLRTPIATLLTEAQALGPVPELEDYERLRTSVVEEMRHLGRLVESFLLLARLDREPALDRYRTVAVNDIVLDVVRRLASSARERGLRLLPRLWASADVAEDAEVRGDPDLLQTMLENLVQNAIKFTSPPGEVAIEVDVVGAEVMIAVLDDGPGIPDENLAHVFDRFFQVAEEAARKRGSGLGLAIVSSIVRLHGGSISAANRPAGGCRFEIRLPLPGSAPGATADGVIAGDGT